LLPPVEQVLEIMLTFVTLNVPCEEEPLVEPPPAFPEADPLTPLLELPAPALPEMLPLLFPLLALPLPAPEPLPMPLLSDPEMRT
jgi:hypothetical protein